ncbi:serum opacification factor [Streptococcus dysgalactiae]|uniref:serum opacification factor n=1 Tax=Streptococcus dysgalactiae TaxID=1334 RepID=UPI001D00656D|nr:serum opacification factor [Streptococcus dysgalactiae]
MATTVMGEEITQSTATEATTSHVVVESSSEEVDTTEAEEVHAFKDANSEAIDITTKVETEQTEEEQTSATTGSQEEDSAPQLKSRSTRSTNSASDQPQLMEVATFTVDKEKTELNIKDGNGTAKLIKNRDDVQREIFDISREIKEDKNQNELEVTLTVTPKQIDEGAEVIVLLDVSKKMTKENIDTAKTNIKTLVDTLATRNTNNKGNHPDRNSVRLITFYNKINKPVELTPETVNDEVDKAWVYAKEDRNWGVDLQGAIHKAREIFNSEKEKKSGKRQHIILFSQGEATFSYDIKDKNQVSRKPIKEPVTSSNPLLPWPFYFDTTTRTHNIVEDAQQFINFLNNIGITQFESALKGDALKGNSLLNLGNIFGISNPLDYITMADLQTDTLESSKFDYSKRVGEGYNFRTYFNRTANSVGLKKILVKNIKENLQKFKSENTKSWLDYFGLTSTSEKIQEWMIDKALDNLFYHRQYEYYNHNLSAQAEAKMARDEGVLFYSFDVTKLNANKGYRASTNKSDIAKRNDTFDAYLKAMSEDKQFLTDLSDKDKFKDVLAEIKITETFENYVSVREKSWKTSVGNKEKSVVYTKSSNGSWLNILSTPEKLTWTISKDELKNAFENEKPLTLTYTLKINKENFNKTNSRRRRATSEAENKAEKIISNTISYKINNKKANDSKLEDVKLTYRKEMVPVPEVDGEVVKPQAPQLPKLPPVIEHGPDLDFTEDTIYRLPLEHGHYKPNTNVTFTEDSKLEKTDTIIGGNVVDFTEDSITHNQYAESGQNSVDDNQEFTEDTKPESNTIIMGGQSNPIDITKDTQSGLSGQMDSEPIIEDTKAPDIIIGGQDDMVTITQDTQAGLSGQANNVVITEDTRNPELTISGQSESVEITEDTQSGMSGFNEATVIEEDTHPKLQFHFDNEEPTPGINKAMSQTPMARLNNNLPQTGDKDKSEAFFTIAALTVIGAAGLLSKKDRKNQID